MLVLESTKTTIHNFSNHPAATKKTESNTNFEQKHTCVTTLHSTHHSDTTAPHHTHTMLFISHTSFIVSQITNHSHITFQHGTHHTQPHKSRNISHTAQNTKIATR
eukprot:c9731_g1_i1.p1 GENE.c9731_g1_i1~~c9731_g1_i1.p1  ORF type:complete len:106 (+),score=38.48 c9731_g1_i1:333-650(+)